MKTPTHARKAGAGQGSPTPAPRRVPLRRILLGPGLLLAVFAGTVLWHNLAPLPGGPPRIERTVESQIPSAPPAAPDPNWLVDQADTLNLNTSQKNRLAVLEARWDRETSPLREALEGANRQLDRRLASRGNGNPNLQQIKEWGASVSELSGQLSAARRAWWGEASAVLTDSQRREAEARWTARLRGKAPSTTEGGRSKG